AEDGIRDFHVTGVQTCALPISSRPGARGGARASPPAGPRTRLVPGGHVSEPELRIVPAAQAACADLRAVFGERGVAADCQCQWFKLSAAEWRSTTPAERAECLRRQTAGGHASAGARTRLVPGGDVSEPERRTVPAAQARCADLRAVFGERGVAADCQCQWFKLPAAEWRSTTPAERAECLRRQTACGHASAGATT